MKILYVEDDESHIELARRAFADGLADFSLDSVSTLKDALAYLKRTSCDVVLCDYRLPDGTGLDMVQRARESYPDVAVVIITNQGDDEIAIAAMKGGAADYIVKRRNYLEQLPVALSEAVARVKLARQKLESEESYRGLFNSVLEAIFIQDMDGRFLDANEGAVKMFGYAREFFIGKTPEGLGAPGRNQLDKTKTLIERVFHDEPQWLEYWGVRANGGIFPMDVRMYKGAYFGQDVVIAVAMDITERKRAERAAQRQMEELTILRAAAEAAAQSVTEDELIKETALVMSRIYTDVCEILLLNAQGNTLIPHPSNFEAGISPSPEGYPITEGITGKAVMEERVVRVDDVATDADYVMVSESTRSELCVLIRVRQKIIGVINVESNLPNAFTADDERLLSTLADGLGAALARLHLFESGQRRTRIIEALADIANESATTRDMEPLFDKIARRALDLLHASNVAIYLMQEDGTIKVVSAQGAYRDELLRHTLLAGQGITGFIIASGKPEIVNDMLKDPRTRRVPDTPDADELETMMSAPLIAHGQSIGAVNAWRMKTGGLFSQVELNFLISLAHQISISIESSNLFHETERRAREAAAIVEVGRHISATLQLDVVMERIAFHARELLRSETSAVYFVDPSMTRLNAVAAIGPDAEEIKNDPLTVGDGILGNIAASQKGEIVNDTLSDPRTIIIKGTDVNSDEHIMGAPVIVKEKLTGLLAVWRIGKEDEYLPRELDFLISLAQQAAVAIENARLFEAEQRRRREAETLQQAATVITSTLEPTDVLNTILFAIKQAIPYDSASIMLFEGERVRIVAVHGLSNEKLAFNEFYPADNSLLEEIRTGQMPLILKDARSDARFQGWAETSDVRGWMGIPLIAKGRAIGCVTLDSYRVGAFDERDAALAQTLAHQASAAIENARLYEETLRRLKEQEAISRLSFSLRAAKTVDDMLPILLDEILNLLEMDTVSIWLYDADKDELSQRSALDWMAQIPYPHMKPGKGIVGHTFISGKPYISADIANDPFVNSENVRSVEKKWAAVFVPIQTSTEIIGVFGAGVKEPRNIRDEQVSLLSTLMEIAGNAIHRAGLYEHSQTQVIRLTALREIDVAISSSFDLRVTTMVLLNHILQHMSVDAADILEFDSGQQTFSVICEAGFREQRFVQGARVRSMTMDNALLKRGDEFISDINNTDYPAASSWTKEGFVSYYAVPLIGKGVGVGILETFFRQPFTPTADWVDFLHTLAGQAVIAMENAKLFENLQRTNQELALAYDTTLEGWGKALELRDKETEGHTRRVLDLTLQLARFMEVPEHELVYIRRGALLHDIGKMGVPDRILRKEGPLTKKEWAAMRMHPQYAYDLLFDIPYLRSALDIPYCHHEFWDGSGYPRGLKGEEIPLAARIFAVVDVWDALLSDRPYRKAWTKSKILGYIRRLKEKQFDPRVADAFLKIVTQKNDI